jgi:hypothetical protein
MSLMLSLLLVSLISISCTNAATDAGMVSTSVDAGSSSAERDATDWMLTSFVVAGAVFACWALCICIFALYLMRLYYQRRRRELLIKHAQPSLDSTIPPEDAKPKHVRMELSRHSRISGNNSKHNNDFTVSMDGYKNDTRRQKKGTNLTNTQTSINTDMIIVETDGMETGNIHHAIMQYDEDSASEHDDEEKESETHADDSRRRKSKPKNSKYEYNHANTQSNDTIPTTRTLPESHGYNDTNPDLQHFAKNHTIVSDHSTFPSLPSSGDITGVHSNVASQQMMMHNLHLSTSSVLPENCAITDSMVFYPRRPLPQLPFPNVQNLPNPQVPAQMTMMNPMRVQQQFV